MLEKYHILQPKPKMVGELTITLQTEPAGKKCHKNSSIRRRRTSSAWLWAWQPVLVTSTTCSTCTSVHLPVCFLIASSINQLFSGIHTDYRENNAWNVEKCLPWNCMILSIPDTFLPNWTIRHRYDGVQKALCVDIEWGDGCRKHFASIKFDLLGYTLLRHILYSG